VIKNDRNRQVRTGQETLLTTVGATATIYGEYLQNMVRAGTRPYTWEVGHLSDFAALFGIATGSLLFFGKDANDNFCKRYALLGAPLIYTMTEMIGKIDPQDIACCWAGSLAAVTISKILTSGKARSLIKRFFSPGDGEISDVVTGQIRGEQR